MRHFNALVLFMISACALHGAAFTSSQAGNWNTSATWGGAGVPGTGDTVTVRHAVTVNVNTIVGDSPSTSKAAPGAILIQNTNGTTQMGTLTVAPGVKLTPRGDIRLDSGTTASGFKARFAMGAGSILEFDSSQATTPGEPVYRIYSVDAGGSISEVWATGTQADPFEFHSVTTGRTANDYHEFIETTGDRIDVRLTHGELSDCGSNKAGVVTGCIGYRVTGDGSDRLQLTSVRFDRTAGLKSTSLGNGSITHGNAYFSLDGVKTYNTFTEGIAGTITDTRNRRSLFIEVSVAKTTGTREIKNCYFDQGANMYGAAQVLVTNNVFDRWPPSTNAAFPLEAAWWDGASQNNVFRKLDTPSGSGSIGALGNIKDLFYYMDDKTSQRWNPHGLEIGLAGNAVVDGFIFEYAQSTVDGNAIWSKNVGNAYTHTYKRLLLLPSSQSTTSITPSGTGPNPNDNLIYPITSIEHSTFMFGGTIGDPALTSYLAESGCPPSGTISHWRSNLVWGLSGYTNYAISTHAGDGNCRWTTAGNSTAFPAWEWFKPNSVSPSGITHNACFRCSTVPSNSWDAWKTGNPTLTLTNLGTVYNTATTSTVPGANDLPTTADPVFVDIRRNLRKWCDVVTAQTPGTCTADDAFEYLADGAGEIGDRITALQAYVRGGFQPTNEAFRSAAHDGGDIGAVPLETEEEEPVDANLAAVPSPVRSWTPIVNPGAVESVWIAPYGDSGETVCSGCTIFNQSFLLDAVVKAHADKKNSVIVYTRLNGYALYRLGNVDPVHPSVASGFDPLLYTCTEAHARGMKCYAHSYVVTMANGCGSPTFPSNHIWTLHGQSSSGTNRWQTVSGISERHGGEQSGCSYGHSADLNHPGFFAYYTDMIDSMLAAYVGVVDGINLDQIRFPYPESGTLTKSYGFNSSALTRWYRRSGTATIPSGTSTNFTSFRQEGPEFVIRKISARAKERDPEFLVTAAVKADHTEPTGAGICSAGFYTICNTYMQKWDDWLTRDWMDSATPMIYRVDSTPADATYFNNWLAWSKLYWPGGRVAPALGAYNQSASDSINQISRAQASGLGYVIFRHNQTAKPVSGAVGHTASAPYHLAAQGRAPLTTRPMKAVRTTGILLGDVTVGTGTAIFNDGLVVEILDSTGVTTLATTRTDATGFWAWRMAPGSYRVRLKTMDGVTTLATSSTVAITGGRAKRVNATVNE